MVLGEDHMTQSEPMSILLRIHIRSQGTGSCTFPLGSLAEEEMPENRESSIQKLFDSLDHPLKLFSYTSPLIPIFC